MEEKIKEIEHKEILNTIDDILSNIEVSKEPAWKTIREYREKR